MPDEATHDGTFGNDTLGGGARADVFVFGPDHGNDVITDFTNGEDVIDLSAFSTIADFSDLTITSDENGVTIDLGAHGGGTILLQGVAIADLDAEDFRFHADQAEPLLDGGGTSGDDVLEADDDGDRLDGGAGDDILTGGAGADILLGREGDDRLHGGAGNDVLEAGAGDDWLHGGEGADDVWGGAGDDILHGGAGDDALEGHGGDDRLHGGAGDDELYGGEGADVLDGGADNDTLSGEAGNDTFVFAAGHGNDTITDFTDGGDLIDLTAIAGISGFEDLTITADGDDAVIDLTAHGGGTIRLENFAVSDLDAADFVFAEGESGTGSEEEEGSAESNEPDAPEDAYASGTGGNDRFLGSDEEDRYDGAGGHDTIFGNGGDDALRGGEGQDSILGEDGDDVLHGDAGNDWLVGGDGSDELHGGAGNDRLVAGSGDDRAYGGEDDDSLNGGRGHDILDGGAGADTFVFEADHGNDTIRDFTDGEDAIDLTMIAGISGFEDLTITADGSAAVIDLTAHGGGTIRLESFAASNLDAEDFRFYEPPADAGADGL